MASILRLAFRNLVTSKYLPSSPVTLFGVTACFLLSGFAALLYQMAWMRQFSTVFGTSEIAVATVLSAYMGGLALGAAISARLISLIPKPVLFYGILEALIAISALAVPWLLVIASWLYSAVLGGQEVIPNAEGLGQPLFYFFVAFIVLIIPTACMGATLPVLTRYAVTRDSEISGRVGGLYAINTLGAVCGALLAGFVLLPRLGLQGTVWFGVFINLVVFALAFFVSRMSAEQSLVARDTKVDQEHSLRSQGLESIGDVASRVDGKFTWLILPVMTLSGLCTFVYEVLWTRLLSHILGGSLSAFAIMLGSFLSGIAIGSFIASRFATSRLRAASLFVFCQIAIALSSVLIYYFLNHFLQSALDQRGNGVLAFLVLMPATLFIGATFPLAVRIYASGADTAASASARVYAWNTFGAILGAALAGFFLVPLLKYEGAIRAAVILNALLALVVASVIISRSRAFKWMQIGLSIGVCLVLVIGYYPQPPENVLRYSSISNQAHGEILFYDVGRSSTVLLYEEQGAYMLRNNGLPEAGAMPIGTPNLLTNQRLLGALPLLARPDIQNALIVGFGAGTAVTGVPPTVEEIDVIELEPKVIEANRLISDRRKYQPLQDPRVSLFINDARSALALSDKEYDMIVSQPSHPWTAGASHLFTREYMQMVSENLSSDGIFLQWINTQFVDEQLLRDLCATIADVYPHVRMYQWSPQVLFFLASDQPMPIEEQILNTGRPFSDAPSFYLELGVATLEDSIAALMMDESALAEFARSGRPITDNFNMMAMESARLVQQGRELSIGKLAEVLRPWIPALDPDSWVHQEYSDQLNFSRFAERYALLNTRSYSNELVGALSEAGNPQSLLLAGELLRLEGNQEAANDMFSAAQAAMPESDYAKYALVQPWLRLLGYPEISEESAGDQNANVQESAEISEIEAVPGEIIAIIESMSGPASAVIEGVMALNQRNFQQLADLDVRLSQTNPADPWFVESVKLRVDWRNVIANEDLKAAFGDQARQILDLAMATNNDHEFLAMRIASAASAGSENEVIESARGYIKLLDFQLAALEQDYVAPAAAELDMKLGQINAISRLVAQVSDSPGVLEAKLEVQSGLTNLVKRMQAVLRG